MDTAHHRPGLRLRLIVLAASVAIFGSAAAFASYVADDASRRRELQELNHAMELFGKANGGNYTLPAGAHGAGVGYVEAAYEGAPRIVDYLAGRGLLNSATLGLPDRMLGHMLYLCEGGKRYTLWTKLAWVDSEETKRASAGCNAHGINGTIDVYGMNYAVGN